jgi:hypothetical protein
VSQALQLISNRVISLVTELGQTAVTLFCCLLPQKQFVKGVTVCHGLTSLFRFGHSHNGTSFRIQRVIYTPAREEHATTDSITAHARQSSGTMPKKVLSGV